MVVCLTAGLIGAGALSYFGITCHSRYRVDKTVDNVLPKGTYESYLSEKNSLGIKNKKINFETAPIMEEKLPEIKENLKQLDKLTPGGKNYRNEVLRDIHHFILTYKKFTRKEDISEETRSLVSRPGITVDL
jgi:hypothetical protein